jgi:hypothetical protein
MGRRRSASSVQFLRVETGAPTSEDEPAKIRSGKPTMPASESLQVPFSGSDMLQADATTNFASKQYDDKNSEQDERVEEVGERSTMWSSGVDKVVERFEEVGERG